MEFFLLRFLIYLIVLIWNQPNMFGVRKLSAVDEKVQNILVGLYREACSENRKLYLRLSSIISDQDPIAQKWFFEKCLIFNLSYDEYRQSLIKNNMIQDEEKIRDITKTMLKMKNIDRLCFYNMSLLDHFSIDHSIPTVKPRSGKKIKTFESQATPQSNDYSKSNKNYEDFQVDLEKYSNISTSLSHSLTGLRMSIFYLNSEETIYPLIFKFSSNLKNNNQRGTDPDETSSDILTFFIRSRLEDIQELCTAFNQFDLTCLSEPNIDSTIIEFLINELGIGTTLSKSNSQLICDLNHLFFPKKISEASPTDSLTITSTKYEMKNPILIDISQLVKDFFGIKIQN